MIVRRNLIDMIADRLMLRVDDAGDDDTGGSGGGGDDTGGSDDAGKTFSQAEVDRIAGRARKEAERATKKTIDEYLASQKADADKTTMDEATRAKAEADQAKADGERLKSEAAQERLAAKIERKLGRAGVDDKALAKACRLLDVELDASDDDIDAEIETLKTDMPGLFAATEEDDETDSGKQKKPPSGVGKGGTPPKGGQGQKTAMERGRELWEQKNKKSTTAA